MAIVRLEDDTGVVPHLAAEQQAELEYAVALPDGVFLFVLVDEDHLETLCGVFPNLLRAPVSVEIVLSLSDGGDDGVTDLGQVEPGVQEEAVAAEDRELLALDADRESGVTDVNDDFSLGGSRKREPAVQITAVDFQLGDGHVFLQCVQWVKWCIKRVFDVNIIL